MFPASRQAGFSLVEVLIAMFILALASAVVLMSIPPRKEGLNVEVQKFGEVLDRVSADAITSGQVRAIRIEEHGYSVYVRVAGKWVPSSVGRIGLPGSVLIDVPSERGNADEATPQIVADSAGLVSGPVVRFRGDGVSVDVSPSTPHREALYE